MFKPYKYTKKEYSHHNNRLLTGRQLVKLFLKSSIPLTSIAVGITFMVVKVLVPVVTAYAESESNPPIISPVPADSSANLLAKQPENFEFKELLPGFKESVNYTEVDGILTKQTENTQKRDDNIPEQFYLTIPSLNIKNAKVDTNSTNLNPEHALGHYDGSCLPDEGCNSFIFGHSTFRGAKNKYENGDYTAIFSKLGDLKYGDEFSIKYNGETYRYVVALTKVQKPEDVDPLSQPLPQSLGRYENTVELFSCTPPGTTKFRLSVVGKLVN